MLRISSPRKSSFGFPPPVAELSSKYS